MEVSTQGDHACQAKQGTHQQLYKPVKICITLEEEKT